ncbi:hypothetical protein [Pseudooceanicola sp. HF7]|uniref:hypothetical protein n=1 Tax=Pseudooceanicola sp. HF7 TaxID=2721560 RepID=UPI0014308D18|nr:hypothetical protein [Pseudooceanicola sp. HF7]NIZ08416.1 hypothetical protein [Pseudooceanicola sp. HF7]
MNLHAAAENATAVEAVHWEPPMAPLDMPRQQLESDREVTGLFTRLFGAWRHA